MKFKWILMLFVLLTSICCIGIFVLFNIYQKNLHEIDRLDNQKRLVNQLAIVLEKHSIRSNILALSFISSGDVIFLRNYDEELDEYESRLELSKQKVKSAIALNPSGFIANTTNKYLAQYSLIQKDIIEIEQKLFLDLFNLINDKNYNPIEFQMISDRVSFVNDNLPNYNNKLLEIKAVTDDYLSKINEHSTVIKQNLLEQQKNYDRYIYASIAIVTFVVTLFYIYISYYFVHPLKEIVKAHINISKEKVYEALQTNSHLIEVKAIYDSYNIMVFDTSNYLRELKCNSQKFERLNRKAEAGIKAKEVFIANVSHELRTPLHSIMGYLDMLETTQLNPLQRNYVTPIQSASKSLLTIISNILNYTEIKTGTLAITPQIEFLDNTLTNVINSTSSLCSSEVTYSIHVAENVPIQIEIDHLKLYQILVNIIGNAIKYTNYGCVSVFINIDTLDDDECLNIVILDTGIGMPEKKIKKILEPFYRIEPSAGKYEGTGLGLTIAVEAIEAMGGVLSIKSKVMSGTTCNISLPFKRHNNKIFSDANLDENIVLVVQLKASRNNTLIENYLKKHLKGTYIIKTNELVPEFEHNPQQVKVLLSDETLLSSEGLSVIDAKTHFDKVAIFVDMNVQLPHSVKHDIDLVIKSPTIITKLVEEINLVCKKVNKPKNKTVKSLTNLSVLLAEDVLVNQTFVIKYLQSEGARVETADNGRALLNKVKEQKFDIILMDLNMPYIDGFEATKRLRHDKAYQSIPIIALSADSDPKVKKRCADIGMNDFIEKPFDKEKLIKSIINSTSRFN